jgi:hypothetical protein
MHGWTASCAECGTLLQIITEGREEFRALLDLQSDQAGSRIAGILNETLGAWAVLPDEHDVAECPICHHHNKLLQPPHAPDLS